MNKDYEYLDVPRWVNVLFILSTIITLCVAGYIYTGALISLLVGVPAMVALFFWLTTTYHQSAPRRIIPWYIGAVLVLLIQHAEQWHFNYAEQLKLTLPQFFSDPVVFNEAIFLSIFPFAGLALFLVFATSFYLRRPLGNYMVWFVFVWAITSGLTPYLFTLFQESGISYFPGMLGGVLTTGVGVWGCKLLLNIKNIVKEDYSHA